MMGLVLDRRYLRLGRWYGAMAGGGTLRLLGGCTAALACGPPDAICAYLEATCASTTKSRLNGGGLHAGD
jgi:hypothetical protein